VVEAEIESRAAQGSPQRLTLSASPGRPGEYEATFTPTQAGRHKASVRARLTEAGPGLGEAAVSFEVERPSLEDERFDVDEKTLVAVAEATGGRYFPLSDAQELVEFLRARQSEKREAVVLNPWGSPLYFALFMAAFVALAGSEWYLRRRLQMA
jgi:hypothetical protein